MTNLLSAHTKDMVVCIAFNIRLDLYEDIAMTLVFIEEIIFRNIPRN